MCRQGSRCDVKPISTLVFSSIFPWQRQYQRSCDDLGSTRDGQARLSDFHRFTDMGIGGLQQGSERNHNLIRLRVTANVQHARPHVPYTNAKQGKFWSYAAGKADLSVDNCISKHIMIFGKAQNSIFAGSNVRIKMTPLIVITMSQP